MLPFPPGTNLRARLQGSRGVRRGRAIKPRVPARVKGVTTGV